MSGEVSRQVPIGKASFTRTVNVTVLWAGTSDLFNVMCKHHRKSALNPCLNGTKNGDVDGTCKRSLTYCVEKNRFSVCKTSLKLKQFVHRIAFTFALTLKQSAEDSAFIAIGLVGMTDALMYIQQTYLQSHTFPEELQKLFSPDAMTSSSIVQVKLSR